ncbi:polysaccharide biosynthesis tyrosine autokinase [Altererythrobacter sp.]|uniref:GumC family protein n=1 Tax=Altererythrobacter sp. TaxID=1872480 RepID=UPI001B0220F8|nr:polysaccharide biosynthesis tyrosine autokinase [Altererythrobacter sp.]MBO6609848.1 polysaccharide biosynthesis tyrosine autokinase [Altererythrobacter sp.]MBO6642204.1 polysaccharide biosynthesis tyrosine autokinase [Altererythrobacter sp.]MBO6709288.1 polysaccharide biosynthesis tyrosine autokinase [Altererythrobacter sp.]
MNIPDSKIQSGHDRVSAAHENQYYDFDHDGGLISIDLEAIWAAIYRSRFWIGGILLACFLAGVVFTILSTPIFRATSTVQIDQEAAKVLGTEDADATAAIADSDRFLQTQIDVIRSRTLAQSVAEDMQLFNNPLFLEQMNVSADSIESSALPPEEAQRELVIETLEENLRVSLPIDSRIASISFDSPNRGLAASMANSFAENYIRNNLQRRFETSSYAREFLQEQLQEAAIQLADSEREALDYARSTRVIDASNAASANQSTSANPQSLVTATLVQLNNDYSAALSRRIAAEQAWQAASGQDPLSLPQALNNLAIQNLLQERARVQADYEQELQRRRDEFPTVKQAKARLDELDRQITAIATSIQQTIKSNYEVALQQERALELEIANLKTVTLDEQEQGVQLAILQRQIANDRQLYDALLTRFNELNAEAGVQANNLSVVDRASTPIEPISPNIPLNLIISLLLGGILSGAFVFGREQFFDMLRTPDDVRRKLSLPLLGASPRVDADESVQDLVLDPKTEVSEHYASLRSSLILATSHGLPRSLSFTSAVQGEGKSSSCYATAIALARIGKRVLVADLDLRRPNQHRMFELENVDGMSDLLTGNKTMAEVTHATEHEGVFFISSGGIPPNPTDLLAGPNLRQVLNGLASQYDILLIDSPPTLGLADAVEIGSATEGVLFVTEAGRNRAKNVRDSIARLQAGGANVLGVLMTKFDAKSAGYSYSYSYNYQYASS